VKLVNTEMIASKLVCKTYLRRKNNLGSAKLKVCSMIIVFVNRFFKFKLGFFRHWSGAQTVTHWGLKDSLHKGGTPAPVKNVINLYFGFSQNICNIPKKINPLAIRRISKY
jgi:hypothetical protein